MGRRNLPDISLDNPLFYTDFRVYLSNIASVLFFQTIFTSDAPTLRQLYIETKADICYHSISIWIKLLLFIRVAFGQVPSPFNRRKISQAKGD
jgi:hypothetical protein